MILAGCHCACLYDLDQTNAHSPSMHTSVHKHTQDLWISFEDLRIGDRANEHSRQLLLFLFSWLHWRTLIAGLMQPRARKTPDFVKISAEVQPICGIYMLYLITVATCSFVMLMIEV